MSDKVLFKKDVEKLLDDSIFMANEARIMGGKPTLNEDEDNMFKAGVVGAVILLAQSQHLTLAPDEIFFG